LETSKRWSSSVVKSLSDKIADVIDEEVDKIIQGAYEVAKKVLTENKPRLIHIAEKLIAQETLEGKELETIFSEPVSSTPSEATATPAPTPAKAKNKTKPVVEKAPTMPQLFPKQAPATSD